MDKKFFFDSVRTSLFVGKLSISQVKGMLSILDEAEIQKTPKEHVAYILATAFHETSRTMMPIEEDGKGKGYDYGKKLKRGNGAGKRIAYSFPDKIYFGRGHTQNTWFENYESLTIAAKKAGFNWDFLNNPELLLQTEPSIWATFYALKTGLYTGWKLSQFFNDKISDPIGARKMVNGSDKAVLIAGYYNKFLKAIN